jgi:hypothetical protein
MPCGLNCTAAQSIETRREPIVFYCSQISWQHVVVFSHIDRDWLCHFPSFVDTCSNAVLPSAGGWHRFTFPIEMAPGWHCFYMQIYYTM